ncbi:hypothetical protein [Mesoterricola silvestris]|uniref:Uncharacterized protein n=1 Tax=Mesoterricola silvestris TaxID=2927979 RepID=A0AA48GT91_9BACT|nr:hypothetical protein [Mesoterricola silvestris]BDU73607.1 hypothetical protein METEAL_27810 [Mesoterricola silvestris]
MTQPSTAPAVGPTLVLKGPPSAVQGKSTVVRVEVRGAVPGQVVSVRGWVKGEKMFESHRTLDGAPTFDTCIPIPFFGEIQILVLQAHCQGSRSPAHAVPLRMPPP